MNPWLLRIGIGVVVSAATYFFHLWINQRNESNKAGPSYVHVNSEGYDGSNISNCCICLTEFNFLKKNEVISLPCKHKICIQCCKTLFSSEVQNYRICPICRQPVSETFVSRIF